MNGGGVRVRAELRGEPASAGDARRLVSRTLREWSLEHLDYSATLLVSEVVTNAVLHARTGLSIELERHGQTVRITVSDGSPRQPQRRRNGVQSSTGRGLGLLSALATSWGSEPGVHPWQKDVWFELPVDPQDLPDPEDGAIDRL